VNIISYEDLGKTARDLLSKPFFAGLLKLDASTRNSDGIKFTVEGQQKEKVPSATLKAEYKDDPNGLSLTEKWDTTGKLSLELGAKDHVAKGLKFTGKAEISEAKEGPAVAGEISAEFANELVNSKATYNVRKGTLGLDLLGGLSGFVAGIRTSANIATQQVGEVDARVGYIGRGYTAEATIGKSLTEYGFSYYQVFDDLNTKVGGTFELKSTATVPVFTVAGEFKTAADAKVNLKADSTAKVSAAYSWALSKGVTAGVSTEIDTTKFEAGAKTGFKLNFEL